MQVELTMGEMALNIAALSRDFETSQCVLKGRFAFQRFDLENCHEVKKIWAEMRETNSDSPMGSCLAA